MIFIKLHLIAREDVSDFNHDLVRLIGEAKTRALTCLYDALKDAHTVGCTV
jgi:hypothetical protein